MLKREEEEIKVREKLGNQPTPKFKRLLVRRNQRAIVAFYVMQDKDA